MTTSFADLLAGGAEPGLFSWRGRADRDLSGEAQMAGWQILPIDTRGIGSWDDFYDTITATWELPDWFGRNLDALFDVLGDRAVQPLIVIWDGLRDLIDLDPLRAAGLVDVLRDAVDERDQLAVIVRDDLGVSGFDALQ